MPVHGAGPFQVCGSEGCGGCWVVQVFCCVDVGWILCGLVPMLSLGPP